MSELARRRDARELWVSRSHLHAALVGALLFGILCFGAGYALGRTKVAAAPAPTPTTLVSGVPGHELEELLAQVERGAMLHPSSAMNYPNALAGGGDIELPTEVAAPSGVEARIPAPPRGRALEGDPAPPGRFTVVVAEVADAEAAGARRDELIREGHAAWRYPEVVDGAPVWRVAVGGYDDETSATQAAEALAPAVGDGTSARVLPILP